MALLGWCVRIAFREENREPLARLMDATPGQVLGVLGLSLAICLVNGLVFWAIIRPAHGLRATDVMAVNGLASFLNYLPFKLGMLARIAVHHRRDGIPLVTISAWLVAWVLALGVSLGPLAVGTLAIREINAVWWMACLAGVGAATAALVAVARRYQGDIGKARLMAWADRLRLRPLSRLMETDLFAKAHLGLTMLSAWRLMSLASGLRIVDMLLQAARFVVAARVLGVELGFGEAMLVAQTYFILGVATPIGVLGSREGGLVALAALIGLDHLTGGDEGPNSLVVLTLFVTATESIAFLAAAGVALAWLRVDRLLLGKTARANADAGAGAGAGGES